MVWIQESFPKSAIMDVMSGPEAFQRMYSGSSEALKLVTLSLNKSLVKCQYQPVDELGLTACLDPIGVQESDGLLGEGAVAHIVEEGEGLRVKSLGESLSGLSCKIIRDMISVLDFYLFEFVMRG